MTDNVISFSCVLSWMKIWRGIYGTISRLIEQKRKLLKLLDDSCFILCGSNNIVDFFDAENE